MERVVEYLVISLAVLAAVAIVAVNAAGWVHNLATPKVRVDVHGVRVVSSADGTYVEMFIDNTGTARVCLKRVVVSWGSGSVVLGDGDPRELAPQPCIAPGGEVYYAGWQGGAWVPAGPVAVTLVLSTPDGTVNVTTGAVAVEENG